MVAEARRRFDGGGLPVEFQTGDALALPFEDGTFDAARSDRVLMFLNDPQKALSELVRVTKPLRGSTILERATDVAASPESHCFTWSRAREKPSDPARTAIAK